MDDSDSDAPYEQALVVDDDCDDEFDLNVPPTSGNEYLRRVRQEAMGCPQVVVANNLDTSTFLPHQTVKVSESSGLLPVPASYRAPMAWQRLQVAEFAAVRQKLIQFKALLKQKKITVQIPSLLLSLSVSDHTAKACHKRNIQGKMIVEDPHANNAQNWCQLCFGRLKLKTSPPPGNEETSSPARDYVDPDSVEGEGTPPLLHIVAHMNQHQVTSVLEYHVNWLEATGFSSQQGRWFYALLASLQKPLTPEVCSWLRRLARLCSNIRASLESASDPKLYELNLIICLVARYFDQRDLADT